MSLLDEIRWRRAGMKSDAPLRVGRKVKRTTVRNGTHTPRMQRVVVKVSYALAKKLAEHHKYISRDGAGRDGERAEVFNAKGLCEIPSMDLAGEKRFFKFIVSPERGVELSLKDFTREFMEHLDKATGLSLRWYAADHYNTDKPHVHVVVRGIDHNGKDVKFDSDFIKEGMREYAALVATKHLGLRTPLEMAEQKKADVIASRPTWIDGQIKGLTKSLPHEQFLAVRPETSIQQDRLVFLTSIGIAWPGEKNQTWELPLNWNEQLRAMGMANDQQKLMGQALKSSSLYTDAFQAGKERHVWTPSMGRIAGTVVSKDYIEDIYKEEPFVVIETDHAYYLVEGKAAKTKAALGERIVINGKAGADEGGGSGGVTPDIPDMDIVRRSDDHPRPDQERGR